jgi:RimJ/RimL family protein N-acetyltransferase
MRVRPCTLDDIRTIELCGMQLSEDPRHLIPVEFTEDDFDVAIRGVAKTIEQNGKPIACFGMVMRWPGLAEVWGFYAADALRQPKMLMRETLSWLRYGEEAFGVRRFQTTAREEFTAAQRWLLHLGFIPEARLPAYGLHGETHVLYGRVK